MKDMRQSLKNTLSRQYVASTIDGKKVKGYREEDAVNPESTTETVNAACEVFHR